MSEEIIAQQHRAADAFSRQDLDGFLAVCDPEIVLVSRHLDLDGSGHLRGHEAVRRWWETLLAVYPDFTSEVEGVRVVGDYTVARHHFRAKAAGSDTELEQRHWQVTKWRDGKAVWWQSLPSEEEALGVIEGNGE